MKNSVLIIITTILFSNCNNQQQDNKTVNQNNDKSQKSTSIEEANRIFNNSFRDINNFNIKVGNNFVDSLHYDYVNSKVVEITLIKDICIGDGCESYQTIVNKENQSVLYFFKSDVGEYGFSNDQYFLNNDSLNFVRNFNVNIETWPTNSSETIWRVEEVTYKFQSEVVSCFKKTALTKDLDGFDFTLKNVTYEIIKVGWQDTYKTKTEELEQHLIRKDSKDRD